MSASSAAAEIDRFFHGRELALPLLSVPLDARLHLVVECGRGGDERAPFAEPMGEIEGERALAGSHAAPHKDDAAFGDGKLVLAHRVPLSSCGKVPRHGRRKARSRSLLGRSKGNPEDRKFAARRARLPGDSEHAPALDVPRPRSHRRLSRRGAAAPSTKPSRFAATCAISARIVDVEAETLERILEAAHRAPSVGLSQPWGFVLVRERGLRERIRQSFLACREAEARRFPPTRRDAYLAHKLEGILEAPLNICVAVDLRDRDEAILGTTVQPEAVRASACCAVENLWLAARAEGIGVGWVSIVEPAVLRAELALPAGVEPVAYLCVGHPVAFRERPMLEETRWRMRRPLADVVHRHDRWEEREQPVSPSAKRASTPVSAAIERSVAGIPLAPTDASRRQATREQSTRLTKPIGSLGRLEELAAWYAGVRGVSPPSTESSARRSRSSSPITASSPKASAPTVRK